MPELDLDDPAIVAGLVGGSAVVLVVLLVLFVVLRRRRHGPDHRSHHRIRRRLGPLAVIVVTGALLGLLVAGI